MRSFLLLVVFWRFLQFSELVHIVTVANHRIVFPGELFDFICSRRMLIIDGGWVRNVIEPSGVEIERAVVKDKYHCLQDIASRITLWKTTGWMRWRATV